MAVTTVKEKNLIKVTNANGSTYTFDINTGILLGTRGKEIKSVPKEILKGITNTDDRYTNWSELNKVVYGITNNVVSHIPLLKEHTEVLKLADSFDNLGITLNDAYNPCFIYELLLEDKALIKKYIKYALKCKEENIEYSYKDFELTLNKEKINKIVDVDINEDRFNSLQYIINGLAKGNYSERVIKSFFINFVYNDFYLLDSYYASNLMTVDFFNYCKYCDYIEEKVTLKDNFLSEYARVYKAYMAQKEKIDQQMFTKAINLHKDEMEFEYGDYRVVIPNSPQDIKNEGKNMHHCVANYAKDCMDTHRPNRSYIVFIRRKATPDMCYITCEIKNGKIGQYFLSHDRYITSDEDKAFKSAYAEHLAEHWTVE